MPRKRPKWVGQLRFVPVRADSGRRRHGLAVKRSTVRSRSAPPLYEVVLVLSSCPPTEIHRSSWCRNPGGASRGTGHAQHDLASAHVSDDRVGTNNLRGDEEYPILFGEASLPEVLAVGVTAGVERLA